MSGRTALLVFYGVAAIGGIVALLATDISTAATPATNADDNPWIPDWAEIGWDSTKRAFRSGDNVGVEIVKRLEREKISPAPDPNYDADKFIKNNRPLIPENLEKQFRLADSEIEARFILQAMQRDLRDQELLSRRAVLALEDF
jgi:hypothetical protein